MNGKERISESKLMVFDFMKCGRMGRGLNKVARSILPQFLGPYKRGDIYLADGQQSE